MRRNRRTSYRYRLLPDVVGIRLGGNLEFAEELTLGRALAGRPPMV